MRCSCSAKTKDFTSSLWTFSLRDRKAAPFGDVKGSVVQPNATFRPDGRWVEIRWQKAAREKLPPSPALPADRREVRDIAGRPPGVVP